jgi:benzoyl-CoA reductase/2-hydroxyglutaryl-CoA dehydratase subunit BcrC/BadD/HgdB
VSEPSSTIGLTSTVPVEFIFAAGLKPLDLNNLFITAPQPEKLVKEAESAGFAHNICSWIKGIYATVINHGLNRVIAVTGGDCSNTVALAELLERRGVQVIPFDYPLNRQPDLLMDQLEKLRAAFSVSWTEVRRSKGRLDRIRDKLKVLDRMTYQDHVISGSENHLFLVTSSDFNSDPDQYERELDHFLGEAEARKANPAPIRLGYLGVPPIFKDLYEITESFGARVVFNETQRQFSMPYGEKDLLKQYLRYTYPYDAQGRIEDIRTAIEERKLDGLIHYTQTFCFRQIYDIIFREAFSVPLLTIEGDRPGPVDARTATRIETFVDILNTRKLG